MLSLQEQIAEMEKENQTEMAKLSSSETQPEMQSNVTGSFSPEKAKEFAPIAIRGAGYIGSALQPELAPAILGGTEALASGMTEYFKPESTPLSIAKQATTEGLSSAVMGSIPVVRGAGLIGKATNIALPTAAMMGIQNIKSGLNKDDPEITKQKQAENMVLGLLGGAGIESIGFIGKVGKKIFQKVKDYVPQAGLSLSNEALTYAKNNPDVFQGRQDNDAFKLSTQIMQTIAEIEKKTGNTIGEIRDRIKKTVAGTDVPKNTVNLSDIHKSVEDSSIRTSNIFTERQVKEAKKLTSTGDIDALEKMKPEGKKLIRNDETANLDKSRNNLAIKEYQAWFNKENMTPMELFDALHGFENSNVYKNIRELDRRKAELTIGESAVLNSRNRLSSLMTREIDKTMGTSLTESTRHYAEIQDLQDLLDVNTGGNAESILMDRAKNIKHVQKLSDNISKAHTNSGIDTLLGLYKLKGIAEKHNIESPDYVNEIMRITLGNKFNSFNTSDIASGVSGSRFQLAKLGVDKLFGPMAVANMENQVRNKVQSMPEKQGITKKLLKMSYNLLSKSTPAFRAGISKLPDNQGGQ